jgi:hypothetical protein
LMALASCPGSFLGVAFANAAPVVALLAAFKLTSSVLSMNAWRSSSSGPETAVGRGRQNVRGRVRRTLDPNSSSFVRPW